MRYAIYGVFVFWFVCSIWPLIVIGQRLFWPEPDPERRARPTPYYVASFVFGMTVTSTLLWLYSSNYMDEWTTAILGSLIFLPEAVYLMWSQGVFGKKKVR